MAQKYDLVVLGGGTGGYPAAIRATQLGMKVALIEKDKEGGVCLHRGCIPSKVFLESAHLMHLARHGSEYGIHVDQPQVDYKVVFARKNRVVNQIWKGVQFLLKSAKVDVIKGHGTITGAHRIAVNGEGLAQEIEYDNLVLATGSVPRTIQKVLMAIPRAAA